MDVDLPDYMLELPHGYTYSAHPVACAAALATLKVLEEQQIIPRVAQSAALLENSIHSLKDCPNVTDIRNYGLAAGLTLNPYENEPARRPFEVAMRMWSKGFYVRCGGDTVQLGLPFIVDETQIDSLTNALAESLTECA
jgi:beta-alanine--pyruvate transaminase